MKIKSLAKQIVSEALYNIGQVMSDKDKSEAKVTKVFNWTISEMRKQIRIQNLSNNEVLSLHEDLKEFFNRGTI